MLKYIIAVLCLIVCIRGDPISLGCPDVEVVQNFQVEKYLGKWYQQATYLNEFKMFARCATSEYSLRDDGKIKVVDQVISGMSGDTETIVGVAYNVSATEAKFIVNFPTMPIHIDTPYWVLGTDYENFSVVWSCQTDGPFPRKNARILTRKLKATKSDRKQIQKVIKDSGIDNSLFEKTVQNCIDV